MLGQNAQGRTYQAHRSVAGERGRDSTAGVSSERATRANVGARQDVLGSGDEPDDVLGVGNTLIEAMRTIMAASAGRGGRASGGPSGGSVVGRGGGSARGGSST